MEENSDEMEKMKEPLLDSKQDSSKGGFRTLPYIIGKKSTLSFLISHQHLFMCNKNVLEFVDFNMREQQMKHQKD